MADKASALDGARIVGKRYLRTKRRQNPEGRMSLIEHLRELRNRLLKCLLVIAIGAGVAGFYSNATLSLVTHPFCSAVINGHTGCTTVGDQLTINSVFDGFFIRIKVAFFFGLIATCPFWLYQLWAFIAPGLYKREKRWAYLFAASSAPLFIVGAALAYVVMSRGLRYLLGLAPNHVLVLPTWDSYLGYFIGMLVGFGLAFELPLVIAMLNIAGVLTHERFRKWRKTLIFVVFLISGMVNPSPDPMTMLILGGICVALVEVAEIFVYFNDKRRARLHPDPYAGLADDELSPLPERVDADSSLN
jgi:sec-independent protein translocase protein TatC